MTDNRFPPTPGIARALAHLEASNPSAAARYQPDELPDAAAEMLALMEDALGVHIYSMEDGEVPPADCPFVASIGRVRAALDMPPIAIRTSPAEQVQA